jgi:rRNA-processing protein FCF1
MLLRAGKTYDDAIKLLDDIAQGGLNDVSNTIPHIGSPSFNQLMTPALLRYEAWTASTQKQLREIFIEGPVVDRLRAEKYWLIVGSMLVSARVASMIHTELGELRSYFLDVANDLRVIKARYGRGPWVVLDTNDLLHYYRLDNIPWSSLYGKDIRVAIPHVVIDEIDSKSYTAGPKFQKRARGVYRMFEMLLDRMKSDGSVILNDGTAFEILADEVGYRRLPNNDDEIVARAATLQQAASPKVVTVVTRDIGMRARALAQGLKVGKIPDKYLIREDNLSASDLDAALTDISSHAEEAETE